MFCLRFGDDAVLHFSRPNTRCPNITVDPLTGLAREDKEPLKTLKQLRAIDPTVSEEEAFRRKTLGDAPKFASNFSLDVQGEVSVGDIVYVEETL